MNKLCNRSVDTQVHHNLVNAPPCYRRQHRPLTQSGAETYCARAMSLPLSTGLDERDAIRVAVVFGGLRIA